MTKMTAIVQRDSGGPEVLVPELHRALGDGQRVGLALLLVMMAFAFYNDLNRLLTG